MKANKLLKTLAASTMSLALLAGVTVMPAMAAPATGDGTNPVTSFTITKNLTKEANTMVPNVSFSFTVTPVLNASGNRNGIPVSNGIAGGVTVSTTNGTADFIPGDALNDATTVSDTVDFAVDGTKFTVPGIYKYTIQETAGGYDGITYDSNVLDLYVYVQNVGGKPIVAYTELVDPNGGAEGGEAKIDHFDNDYDSAGTALHDLVLYKVVSGNAANMSEKFTFSVKIDGEAGEKYYVEYGTFGNGNFTKGEKTVILTSGSEATITLGHNEAVKVYGLDSDDAYTITEKNANTNGYILKINDADQKDEDGQTNGTISADATVKYENSKNATTPTGVILNVAPYALMVVIAVAGVAVFMRKRVED